LCLSRFLATARVAKHRLFAWVEAKTLPDSQIIAFASEGDYFFGVLHSRAHEIWALRMGTFLGVGNDPRYTPTTCFETFPFPEPTDEQRAEIAEAARRLDGLRRNWLNPEDASDAELKKRTLTNLYNQRPTWLANAHARLDAAVFAAYGWTEDVADEDILKNLLALNFERCATQS
jgi:type II restriction/modification system DNA methylase subunit YeeA